MSDPSGTEPSNRNRAGQERLKAAGVRPVPAPDELTAPYWAALNRHELVLQRCGTCGAFHHPPLEVCTCGADAMTWVPVSGRASIYSFVVDYRLLVPGFSEPYVIAQVNPVETEDDTVRIVTNIVGCRPEDVEIGMAVHVEFVEVAPGVTLANFAPRTGISDS
jgi:uncharacterized protein